MPNQSLSLGVQPCYYY